MCFVCLLISGLDRLAVDGMQEIAPLQVLGIAAKTFSLGSSFIFLLVTTVTRWLVNSFNIWPLTTINFCPIAHIICQSRLAIFPNL